MVVLAAENSKLNLNRNERDSHSKSAIERSIGILWFAEVDFSGGIGVLGRNGLDQD